MSYLKQVSKGHYVGSNYDSRERFISYFNQKEAVINALENNSCTVLEVGKGNGFLSDYLKKRNYFIETFDFAEDLKPDYLGDITQIARVVGKKFDVVACFEILEHIKYIDVESTVKQLSSITNKYLLISVPHSSLYLSFWFKINIFKPFSKKINIPFPIKHVFDGEHDWELGK